jgi:hypothetical protein
MLINIGQTFTTSAGIVKAEARRILMTSDTTTKCAHLPCQCAAKADDKFCGDACKEAGASEVEIACQCNHVPCVITA